MTRIQQMFASTEWPHMGCMIGILTMFHVVATLV